MRDSGNDFTPAEKRKIALIILTILMLLFVGFYLLFSRSTEHPSEQTEETENTERVEETLFIPSSPIPADDETLTFEDTSLMTPREDRSSYQNNEVLKCNIAYGMEFQLGIADTSLTDAIYLDPHFSYEYAANPNEQYGVIILASRVPVEYSSNNAMHGLSGANRSESMVAVIGRTFDQCVPGQFKSQDDFGIRWKNDPLLDGEDYTGTTLYIRIIRISDGYLMGTARASIAYDDIDRVYRLENLRKGDVSSTGELTSELRDQIVDEAIQYLIDGNEHYQLTLASEVIYRAAYEHFIIVEKLPRPYYSKLMSEQGEVIPSGTFSKCDIYAVNIPYNGFCYFTVYFAPEAQVHGMQTPTYADEDLKLLLIGYDPFNPLSASAMRNLLQDSDADKFHI